MRGLGHSLKRTAPRDLRPGLIPAVIKSTARSARAFLYGNR
jgi:hypothetical protein